jgi:acetylornithine deacetylase/succinyl-diaminopimelate desuccinylase-like protein
LFAGFKPERTLIFGFGYDEKVGSSKGAAHLAQLLTSRFPLQGSSRNARSHSVLE